MRKPQNTINTEDKVFEQDNIKNCKVTYWNKYSKVLGFVYDNTNVQMTINKDIGNSKTVNVKFENGIYELI